jgi:DNA-binding MarR family transcriptional regulator
MRDQQTRRHDRHDAETTGCRRPGQDRHDSEDQDRRPRGGGRRGQVRGGFPGRIPGGFRSPGPWAGGPRVRGRRARRGDVRAAALALLTEQPMNGYQIIGEIGGRSGGVWRPSPGSVYPALQQLQDEDLIQAEPGEAGRRGYVLTDSGRQYAAAHVDELRSPWDVPAAGSSGAIEMRTLMGQLEMAAFQIVHAGTGAQQAQAHKILTDSRTSLYRILAEDQDKVSVQEK